MCRLLRTSSFQRWLLAVALVLALLLSACGPSDGEGSVPATTIAQIESTSTESALASAPTWTPLPIVTEEKVEPTEPSPPTNTAVPTSTEASATDTPEATQTPTAQPTDTVEPTETSEPTATIAPATSTPAPVATSVPVATAVPEATAVPAQPTAVQEPTTAPEPVLGLNLLPNPSFEEGHYNQDGVPELQLPVKWRLEWDEGPTGVGDAAWDVYVRPEARVLSTAFLPPEEHALYIYNGQHTVKIFKGQGAVSFRLMTDITLEPGIYVIEAKMFADIVEKWENREKQWAQDPYAAEFRFLVGDGGTVWTPQNFGRINVHNYTFTVDQTKTIPIGIGLRGRYAIANNGWFVDDLSLRRVE